MESSFDEPANNPPEMAFPQSQDIPIAGLASEPPVPDQEIANFLTLHSDEFQPIDRRQITLDRIIGLIVSAIVIFFAISGLGTYRFAIESSDWIFWLVLGGSILIMIAIVILAVIWPPIEYRHTFWKLQSTGMEIRRGVYWKHQTSIPSSRVQHVDVSQGPLQRNFGLATLTIHTAGTSNASVELAGLSFDTATALRDQLVEQREALNVV